MYAGEKAAQQPGLPASEASIHCSTPRGQGQNRNVSLRCNHSPVICALGQSGLFGSKQHKSSSANGAQIIFYEEKVKAMQ